MGAPLLDPDRRSEYCPACGRDTVHAVSLSLQREGDTTHSKEPYRVSVCDECGATERLRMNNQ